MSCPLATSAAFQKPEIVWVPTDKPNQITKQSYEKVKTKLLVLSEKVDNCRDRVTVQGFGHCMEYTVPWLACYREQIRMERAIAVQCSGLQVKNVKIQNLYKNPNIPVVLNSSRTSKIINNVKIPNLQE